MERRGVGHDVGRYLYGDWLKDYDPTTVHRDWRSFEMIFIAMPLRIHSRDLGRLAVTAEDALRQGLEVRVFS